VPIFWKINCEKQDILIFIGRLDLNSYGTGILR
jgi:hypothetical protein